jgi:hypothetical protein
MIRKQGKPITAAPLPRRRAYVLANQAETSSTAQRQIRQSDIPQQDSQLRVPAPTNPAWRSASDLSGFAKQALQYGGKGRASSVREMSDPSFGAVGYQSGATKPKRPGTSLISGYPLRSNKRVAGDGNQPLAKSIKSRSGKMRTNLDIFNPRVLHEAGLTKL